MTQEICERTTMSDLVQTVRKRLLTLPQHEEPKRRRFDVIRRVLHMKSSKENELSPYELQLCAIVAWTGVLVLTAIVLRSLYLLYLKPEGT